MLIQAPQTHLFLIWAATPETRANSPRAHRCDLATSSWYINYVAMETDLSPWTCSPYHHGSHLSNPGFLLWDAADLDTVQSEASLQQSDSIKPWFTQSAKKNGEGKKK